MFWYNLLISFRRTRKDWINTFVNLFGLSLSFSILFVVLLFVFHEFSYDRFHINYNKICRLVVNSIDETGVNDESATTLHSVGPQAYQSVSGIAGFTRIYPEWDALIVEHNQHRYSEKNIAYVDTSFFSVFSFPIIDGSINKLSEPNTVVLTKTIALKYFGTVSPINMPLRINNLEYEVVGLIEDFPSNSHINFDILISFSTIDKGTNLYYEGSSFFTYFKFHQNTNVDNIKTQLLSIVKDLYKSRDIEMGIKNRSVDIYFQPVSRIHLYSNLPYELNQNGNINALIYSIILALFILIMSTINFINIYTAVSERNVKNVGIHKILGANKTNILIQIIIEVTLITLTSFVIASIFSYFFAYYIIYISFGIIISLSSNTILFTFFLFFVLSIAVSFIASLYPSIFLSNKSPKKLLSGLTQSGKFRKSIVHKTLLLSQFLIGFFLIICLFESSRQIKYFKTKELGFEKDNIIVFTNFPHSSNSQVRIIRNELLNLPFVKDVSISKQIPGEYLPTGTIKLLNKDITCNILRVDSRYFNTLGLTLLEGRTISENNIADRNNVIINQSALAEIGKGNLTNNQIVLDGETLNVVGIVKDFHTQSFHHNINPVAIKLGTSRSEDLIINLENYSHSSMEQILGIFNSVIPEYIVDFYFLKDKFNNMYASEVRIHRILKFLTYIGLFISFIGIWAFSSLFISRRLKEVSIRKIFGARASNILHLLIADIIPHVFFSAIIASPLSYIVLSSWSKSFYYTAEFSFFSIVYSFIIILFISLLSICYHFIILLRTNPSVILKYE